MKHSYSTLCILLWFSLFWVFESCKKENTASSGDFDPADTVFVLKMKVNGKDFPISRYTATLLYVQDSNPVMMFRIYDTMIDYHFIEIELEDFNRHSLQLKTYYNNSNVHFGFFSAGGTTLSNRTGQLNLTKFDQISKKMSGNFSFHLQDMNVPDSSFTLTDGVFSNLPYKIYR